MKIGAIKIISFLGLLLIGVVAVCYLATPMSLVFGLKNYAMQRQRQLIYEIDHATLAAEARAFADQRRSRPGFVDSEPQILWWGDPDIPASLRVLKPTSIGIFQNRIQLEFGGPPLHYGIVIFNTDLEGGGTKKLAKGVWFYSENGRYPDPS